MEFKDLVRKRYATKKFSGEMLPQEKVDELLEIIRLAPSSFGLQPWKIKVISDAETKEKLLPVSFNQPQITTCSHLLVFCANGDVDGQISRYEQLMKDAGVPEEKVNMGIGMMKNFDQMLNPEQKVSWAQRQAYIALGNAVNGAKSLGFDSCPMEGFDP
jgi:nitroreductase / dihydropteridine reductase